MCSCMYVCMYKTFVLTRCLFIATLSGYSEDSETSQLKSKLDSLIATACLDFYLQCKKGGRAWIKERTYISNQGRTQGGYFTLVEPPRVSYVSAPVSNPINVLLN